jgi:hypothetical protein
LGGGGNDAVKNTNTNEIQILFAGYHKPAKLGKHRSRCSNVYLDLDQGMARKVFIVSSLSL